MISQDSQNQAQRQTAVTAYLLSKQYLSLAFVVHLAPSALDRNPLRSLMIHQNPDFLSSLDYVSEGLQCSLITKLKAL